MSGNLADRPSLRPPWKTTPAANVNVRRSPDFGAGRATDDSNDHEREMDKAATALVVLAKEVYGGALMVVVGVT